MKDCGQFKKLYDKGAYVCVCERERGRERDCIEMSHTNMDEEIPTLSAASKARVKFLLCK